MSHRTAQSPVSQAPSDARPPYSPPQYLLSSTGLSRDEFLAQYEAFTHSLQHISFAPELVFERLVGNLKQVFNVALAQANARYATAEEAWRREKSALLADRGHATATAEQPTKPFAPRAVPAVIQPVLARSNETYLQFWFSSSIPSADSSDSSRYPSPVSFKPTGPVFGSSFGAPPAVPRSPAFGAFGNPVFGTPSKTFSSSTRVHMAATTTPIPYGLASSWPGMNYVHSSAEYGCYDTRMDPRITAKFLRTSFSHFVTFNIPFTTPPAVMVWLTGLSGPSGASVSVQITANNITETGFALHFASGSLRSVGVAWAVWPETPQWGQKKLVVGSVSIVAPRSPKVPKFAEFGDTRREGEPVLVAVCAVDVELAGGVCMDVEMAGPLISDLPQQSNGGYPRPMMFSDPPKLSWRMRVGPAGAKVYSARVAYAAR